MSYRTLDSTKIIETLQRLHQRVSERFPQSGLAAVCLELLEVSQGVQQRALMIGRPQIWLRMLVYGVAIAGIVSLALVARVIRLRNGDTDVLSLFQGVEAAVNIVVLAGAALAFLVSIETRIKRRRALRDLHELRSLAHVIDMHQLTKDPSSLLADVSQTQSSPTRKMTPFELTRYLDYCSEMLSHVGKLAAVYAQNLPDAVVIEAVNDIESMTTDLSRKIWQKITILEARAFPLEPPDSSRHQSAAARP